MPRLLSASLRVVRDSLGVYWELVKIMVPVMILVRLAVQFGLVDLLGAVLAPAMTLVGLPGEMGLVWAAACLVNIYGGAAALIALLPQVPLTVAQMTVLGCMILAAHSMPIELRVCQRAGVGLLFAAGLRFGAALAYGAILAAVYGGLDLLTQPVEVAWLPSTPPDAGWLRWAWDSAVSLATIYLIILALLAVLRVMEVTGITKALSKALEPVLRLVGIGPQAVPLTMVGILLGLSYGGALIIREAQAGHMPRRDILLAVSFMAICHSLIEDTLFIMALGGHWSGVLVGRVIFSLALMILLARLVHALPDRQLERWMLSRSAPAPAPAPAGKH